MLQRTHKIRRKSGLCNNTGQKSSVQTLSALLPDLSTPELEGGGCSRRHGWIRSYLQLGAALTQIHPFYPQFGEARNLWGVRNLANSCFMLEIEEMIGYESVLCFPQTDIFSPFILVNWHLNCKSDFKKKLPTEECKHPMEPWNMYSWQLDSSGMKNTYGKKILWVLWNLMILGKKITAMPSSYKKRLWRFHLNRKKKINKKRHAECLLFLKKLVTNSPFI